MKVDKELLVYDMFELKGYLINYSSLEWIRRFNEYGGVKLTMPFTEANYELLKVGYILYKRDVDEACMIYDVKIIKNEKGGQTLYVDGYSLSYILTYRTEKYTNTDTIKGFADTMINQAFIKSADANRNIPELRLLDYTIRDITVNISENQISRNFYEMLSEICKDNDIGFKIRFNYKEHYFDFFLYEGKKSAAIFDPNLNNVYSQDYKYTSSTYRNVCIVTLDEQVTIVNNQIAGLERREVGYITSDKEKETAQTQGESYLRKYKILESMDAIIDQNSPQYIYKADWDLGDIALCRNDEWGKRIERPILEIIEYFDVDAFHLNVVFGDYL